MIDTVYVIDYDNGESYEDHHNWIGDLAFSSIEKCEQALKDEGFSFFRKEYPSGHVDEYWSLNEDGDDDDYYDNRTMYADIKELKLI